MPTQYFTNIDGKYVKDADAKTQLDDLESYVAMMTADYSTTERKIGKWIDGSDLYQRTFEVTGLTNDGVWNQRILGTSDIDIVDWIGYLEYEDGNHVKQRYPINFKSGEYDGCCISVVSDLTLMAKIAPLTLIKAVITIKYTKPSAQANIQQTEEPTDEMR